MIDQYVSDVNQEKHDAKIWKFEGIDTVLWYEGDKEKHRKNFGERFPLEQKPPRSHF